MVNVILCGTPFLGKEELRKKEELLKRIKTLKEIKEHDVISEVQQDVMKQRNLTNTENLRNSSLVEFQKWVIKNQCLLEKKHKDFLSDSSPIDSLVQVHHAVNEGEANKLKNLSEFQSSLARHQEGLVILLLSPPSSFQNVAHREHCETVAQLYRNYFHSLRIPYLELRSSDLQKRLDTVKKAIRYGQIPLETTRLQKYSRSINAAKEIKYTTNFAFYKQNPKESDNVLVPTILISEHLSEQKWTSFSKGETNRFIHRYGVQNLALVEFHITVKANIVESMLKTGIVINGSLYSFLGCSSKGLKERKCYLWKGSEKEVQDRLLENGAFEKISSLPKRMARIGLLFSAVRLTDQEPVKVIAEGDIEIITKGSNGGSKKCFTDGCGGIGLDLASKIHEKLEENVMYPRNPNYQPSVYQVRFQGYKGVLALDPTLDGNSIKVRKSMEKFETTAHPRIGVCKQSKAHSFGHLNKQFIMLLSGLGVPDQVLLQKQKEHFDSVLEMGKDTEKTIRILQWQNQFDVAQTVMRRQGFQGCDAQIMKCIHKVQQKLMSKSEKLSILIPESRNIFGVCDPTRTLQYGECFLRITLGNLGQPKAISGKVVVCKSPCYLLGDVRVLKAVNVTDNPEVGKLNHLVDCIVFPVQGKRPHPDEIAGSDLDGDEFFVSWDSHLIPPETKSPYDYPGSNTESKEKDMIRYFAKQNENKKLTSRVNRYFNEWADLKGVTSYECESLGKLFSRVVDAGKTGEYIAIRRDLIPNNGDQRRAERHADYVWQKMLREATKRQDEFKEGIIRNPNPQNAADLSPSFVEEVVGQKFSNISEFEKFTFALNHTDDIEEVLYLFGNSINFALFSQAEKCEALLLGVPEDRLENALNWSRILPHDELAYFKMQTHQHRWSFYFQSKDGDFDWKLLLRGLAEFDQTFIVFDMPDDTSLVLEFLTKWKEGKGQSVPAGTICSFFYSRRFGYRHKYVLGPDYSMDLTGDTLQLYRNRGRTDTFVWLKENVISVDLLRFDRAIFSNRMKPHPFVNKIPFRAVEVYAHNNTGIVPYLDTYEANDVLPVPEVQDDETSEAEGGACTDFETMKTKKETDQSSRNSNQRGDVHQKEQGRDGHRRGHQRRPFSGRGRSGRFETNMSNIDYENSFPASSNQNYKFPRGASGDRPHHRGGRGLHSRGGYERGKAREKYQGMSDSRREQNLGRQTSSYNGNRYLDTYEANDVLPAREVKDDETPEAEGGECTDFGTMKTKKETDQKSRNSNQGGDMYQKEQGRDGHRRGQQRRPFSGRGRSGRFETNRSNIDYDNPLPASSNQNYKFPRGASGDRPHYRGRRGQHTRGGYGRGRAREEYQGMSDSRREQSMGRNTSYDGSQPEESHEEQNWSQGRNQHYRGSGYQGRGGYERQEDRGQKSGSGRRGNRGRHNTKGFHNPEQRGPNSQM